ncbi:glycogen synthase [Petrotoga sp. 9PWA.NaAc.5.4]|uniref:glycogen synthase n=1 Tax=Petrotoga sp. 9PWA.NaAc.5.4 TaxID=1434328 RepID=UPI000CA80534|nr:glycogen/starch synthase [Petrotoga sp. 9PWA.NaAc.5.4]PNR96697.1 glycogen synthase [Petrotoga sp. 9PWA.NaAc.5.4]
MKISFVSFEVSPFVKVGGLADVAGALPKYLKKLGEECYVIMPFHKNIEDNFDTSKFEIVKKDLVPDSHKYKAPFSIYKSFLPDSDVKIYFLKTEGLFDSENVYEEENIFLKTSYFSDIALKTIKEIEPDTNIVHINDWHTSLIPVYLKTNYFEDKALGKLSTLLTIHNIGYQGVFAPEFIFQAGLPGYLFNIDALEFYGKINVLKGGLMFSDIINTVSPTYAKEIQTSEYGYGLEGILKIRSEDLYGVINGIDYNIYNPETDPHIFYPIRTYEDKLNNKIKLQEYLELPIKKYSTLISFIGRLFDQKGLDLISNVINYFLLADVQFVMLGTGDKKYERFLISLEDSFPEKVSINIKFDADLAQKIYAGSDIFLMPSRYEPCGLGQMYAMRYGTIPVVRYTGGLVDTVQEYDSETKKGTGFGFYDYSETDLLYTILKATYYNQKKEEEWKIIFKNCMQADFSYEKTAKSYVELYKKAIAKKFN